jgi:hypothetical protein
MLVLHRYNSLFHASSKMNILLGLAFSLVVDLNLYLPKTYHESHEKFLGEMKGIITCNFVTWGRRVEPSREEKKAILGCYYVFSSVGVPSPFFRH